MMRFVSKTKAVPHLHNQFAISPPQALGKIYPFTISVPVLVKVMHFRIEFCHA